MRLMIARCTIDYQGRLSTHLAPAVRLLMTKADGTFMVWSDHGGRSVKPLNWMTPPTVLEEDEGRIVVRKRAGATEERLEIELHEVLLDVTHEMAMLGRRRQPGQGRRGGAPAGAPGKAPQWSGGVSPRPPRVADRHRVPST